MLLSLSCCTCRIAINQNLLVLAMKLTNSTTIVTALSNLTPQSPFIVAILTRSLNCHYTIYSDIFISSNFTQRSHRHGCIRQAGDGEARQGQRAGEAGGHAGRPQRRDGGHLLRGARARVHAPARARGRAPAARRRRRPPPAPRARSSPSPAASATPSGSPSRPGSGRPSRATTPSPRWCASPAPPSPRCSRSASTATRRTGGSASTSGSTRRPTR